MVRSKNLFSFFRSAGGDGNRNTNSERNQTGDVTTSGGSKATVEGKSNVEHSEASAGHSPAKTDEIEPDSVESVEAAVAEAAVAEAAVTDGDKVHSEEVNFVQEDGEGGRRTRTRTGRMPRQWLIDRCDGESKYGDSRPPCRLCWVPFPVKWYPDILEQNCMCEACGRIGCMDPENTRLRRALLWTAFATNICGLFCLIVASLAMTKRHFNLLWRTSFSTVWLEVIEGPSNHPPPTFFAIGLRAAAFASMFQNVTDIIEFEDFCDFQHINSEDLRAILQQHGEFFNCDSCQEVSKKICPSLFLSMLSYIPNFTTDILRMWSNYDVNCQKFLATTFSWISLATAIYTWVNYRKDCFSELYPDPISLNEEFLPVKPGSDDVYLVVQFRWHAGPGQVCLAVASLLKIIDIVMNIVVPTPTITRDHEEQVEYEWKYGPVSAEESNPDVDQSNPDCVDNSNQECSDTSNAEAAH